MSPAQYGWSHVHRGASVCVLTMYHGPHAVLRPVTLLPLRSYAERHGYDLRVVDPVDGLPASWGKVAALREALDTYPVVAWLDADTLIIDESHPIDQELPPGATQALASDSRYPGGCTALWALRREGASALDAVWALRDRDWGREWEQGALHHVLDEDQDLLDRTVFLDEAWGDLIGGHPSPIAIHNGYQAGDPANRARVLRRRRNQLAARSAA